MGEVSTAISFLAATALLAVALLVIEQSAESLIVVTDAVVSRDVDNYDGSSAEVDTVSETTTYRPALFVSLAVGLIFVPISLYIIVMSVWPKRNL